MTVELYNYKELIEKFLDDKISIQEFESTYLEKFKEEKAPMSEDVFLILDWLFAEVDLYTDDEDEIKADPEWNISENQLRKSVQETLDKLRELEK